MFGSNFEHVAAMMDHENPTYSTQDGCSTEPLVTYNTHISENASRLHNLLAKTLVLL